MIRQAGLQTPLDEQDVREIASQSSSDTPSTLGTAEINLPSAASSQSSSSSERGRSSNRQALRSALRKTPQRGQRGKSDHVLESGGSSGGDASVDLSLPSSVIRDLQTPPRRSSHRAAQRQGVGHGSKDAHHSS